MNSIRRFHRDGDMAEAVAEIRDNGVVIIENLIPAEVADALAARVAGDLEEQEPGGGDFFGNRKRSVMALFARGPEFSEHLLCNERLLELADGILLPQLPMAASSAPVPEPEFFEVIDPAVGPNCHHYHINASVAMQVCGGGQNQVLHRDEWRYLPYMHRDPEGPELTLAFMVALTDFTLDNGATRFIPRSNRWPRDRKPEEHEVVQAVMPKGSVASWLGSVFHGLGSSRVHEPRTGLIFSFGVDRMMQEENQFMAVPPDIAGTLSKKARQLLGYRSSPALNYIEGLDDDHILATEPRAPR